MEIVTVAISALGLLFAAMAAWGALATVQLTKELRWEADIRRVLEALVGIQGACREILQSWTDPPSTGGLGRAQRELQRALAFPQPLTDNATALELLDRLQRMDMVTTDSGKWIHGIMADAGKAETLLAAQPPPERMPDWYLRLVTVPRRRARRLQNGEQ